MALLVDRDIPEHGREKEMINRYNIKSRVSDAAYFYCLNLFYNNIACHVVVPLAALDGAVKLVSTRFIQLHFLGFFVFELYAQFITRESVDASRVNQSQLKRVADFSFNFRFVEFPVNCGNRYFLNSSSGWCGL